ncbi:leukocyte surface antigen CD53 isoform X2 [Fopius arisanus]|uniref:Tetraspanin n=1 Tax=Fopius arisanus TaxID=64838 RepID=A0A9R1U0V7_9HYME|nr:PREDICTED: leukocyte surface antigen CD53-like isoform X2 [Fopius arisanus]
MKYLKISLFMFNLLIWLAGFMVVVIGVWLLLEPSNGHLLNLFVRSASPHYTVHIVAYSLLGLGFIVLAVGFVGCRASLYGSQCIITAYVVALVVLIITELATAAVGGFLAYRGISGLEERLLERLADHYGHDSTSDLAFTQSLDYSQYKFNCCGIYGDSDYNGTAWWRDFKLTGINRRVPLTCCILKNHEVKNAGSPMSVVSRVFHKDNEKPWVVPQPKDEIACQSDDPMAQLGYRHKEGCMEKVTVWVRYESLKLVFMGLIMAAIQTVGIIVSTLMCKTMRDIQNGG